mmetsp:Transcript_13709/g.16484  ORF Transcript_13709/g.16484 Transcript_13709/m.16484 type:complete len:210 (-) Transcript_13709:2483-3112(-)
MGISSPSPDLYPVTVEDPADPPAFVIGRLACSSLLPARRPWELKARPSPSLPWEACASLLASSSAASLLTFTVPNTLNDFLCSFAFVLISTSQSERSESASEPSSSDDVSDSSGSSAATRLNCSASLHLLRCSFRCSTDIGRRSSSLGGHTSFTPSSVSSTPSTTLFSSILKLSSIKFVLILLSPRFLFCKSLFCSSVTSLACGLPDRA